MKTSVDNYNNILKPYASNKANYQGRFYEESKSIYRSEYQRDRDRVIHCSSFRRLKHKTQVFVYYEGDHFRTRLTHSLEVSQLARSIARYMGLNEDLCLVDYRYFLIESYVIVLSDFRLLLILWLPLF